MKKIYFLFIAALIFSANVFTATITSTATGNWNAGATWVGGSVPAATDNAVIANTHVVTLTANASITNITINAGGTLNGSSFTLSVAGNWRKIDLACACRIGHRTNTEPELVRKGDDVTLVLPPPGTFIPGTGTVIFNGTGPQTIGDDGTTFYNLTSNTTGPLIFTRACVNLIVTNTLTMTAGLFDLSNVNCGDFVLGTSTANTGTLIYTAGWMYGSGAQGFGAFKRWFNTTSFAVADAKGHFPMGSSTDYRPLWVAYSSNLTAGGTVSVVHTPTYPSGTIAATHIDGSWTPPVGGTTLQGVSNSYWDVLAADGFTISGSNDGIMRFGGTGFQTFTLTDLDASLTTTVVGTYGASTNVNTPLEVNRTVLSTANFTNIWRIGTKDVGQSPLPVEWLYFNAIPENNSLVRCEWSTATEMNNDYFAIERSKGGVTFEKIGTMQGAPGGNSSVTLYYVFYDHEPYSGISYYRLKQVNYNGQYEYSAIRQVYIGTFTIITIYPNPSSEYIHYTIASEDGGTVTVKAIDVLGREVISTEEAIEGGITTKKLSTANLSSGSYLLRIITGKQFATANPSSGGEKTQKQFVVK